MALLSAVSDWTLWNYITAVLDISILAYVLYKLLLLIQGTRAIQLLKGILILFLVATLSDLIGLHAVGWILEQFWSVIFVALAVIFQPELRRALERIGRGNLLGHSDLSTGDIAHIIDGVVGAVTAMSKTKTGALLVLERDTGLTDYIESGILLDAQVSQSLLVNIFVKDTPLHDGATIIRGDRVVAAACFLPLSDNPYISLSLGTRHRAGIGISEVSDALVLIVSEETGIISLAEEGKLIRNLDERKLREVLAGNLNQSRSAGELLPFRKKGGQSR